MSTEFHPQHSEFDQDGYEAHILAGGAPFGGEYNATIGQAVEAYQAVIASLKRERDAALVTVKRLQDELARHLEPDAQRDAELDHLAEVAAAGNEREKELEADLERAREAVRLCLPHAPTVTAIKAARLAFGDDEANAPGRERRSDA